MILRKLCGLRRCYAQVTIVLAVALMAVLSSGVGDAIAQEGRRLALVIGNSKYEHANWLGSALRDAEAVAHKLKMLEFDKPVLAPDQDLKRFRETLVDFKQSIQRTDTALVYYSGHAFQSGGVNYLMPLDANPSGPALIEQSVALAEIIADVSRRAYRTIVIVDACRDAPASPQARFDTLARFTAEGGFAQTIVVFATAAGRTAAEAGQQKNSYFTAALLNQLDQPGVEVEAMMKRVAAEVARTTNSQQNVERQTWLTHEFYFRSEAPEFETWLKVRESLDPIVIDGFLKRFPKGEFASPARERRRIIEVLAQMSGSAVADAPWAEVQRVIASNSATDDKISVVRLFIANSPPQDQILKASNALEDLLWAKSSKSGEMEVYLKEFPTGRYAAEAVARLALEGWNSLKDKRYHDAYALSQLRAYIVKFPKGPYTLQAVRLWQTSFRSVVIDELPFDGDLELLEGTFQGMPSEWLPVFVTEIADEYRFWDKTLELHTLEAYVNYLRQYPSGHFSREARGMIRHLHEVSLEPAHRSLVVLKQYRSDRAVRDKQLTDSLQQLLPEKREERLKQLQDSGWAHYCADTTRVVTFRRIRDTVAELREHFQRFWTLTHFGFLPRGAVRGTLLDKIASIAKPRVIGLIKSLGSSQSDEVLTALLKSNELDADTLQRFRDVARSLLDYEERFSKGYRPHVHTIISADDHVNRDWRELGFDVPDDTCDFGSRDHQFMFGFWYRRELEGSRPAVKMILTQFLERSAGRP